MKNVPMIAVQNLSKKYGPNTVLDSIDFRIQPGNVVGFLGPNGAGKSTAMRILCGCISASEGTVRIDGEALESNPKKIKALMGYLPENPPLYGSMTVRSYIRFAADLRRVADPEQACTAVLAQVGLDGTMGGMPISDRIIGRLSKGYRQRVGLAQALVHNPKVLLLDEPTSGLDPAQRRELRQLLSRLARESKRTILLSTHILSDVQAICDHVVVLHRGRLIAQGRLEALQNTTNEIMVEVRQPEESMRTALLDIDGVSTVQPHGRGVYTVTTSKDVRPQIAQCIAPFGMLSLRQSEDLESLYLRLTQEAP